jgi:hypothetical protein
MGAAGLMAAGGAQAGGSLISAYSQARAVRAQGRYEARSARLNTQLADLQADDAIARGETDLQAQLRQTKVLSGAQRASMAAQGIDLGMGSAQDIGLETKTLGAMDALQLRNNAFREAFGYRVQATEAAHRGRMARISSRSQARSGLITGGMRAVSDLAQGFNAAGKYGGGQGGASAFTGARASGNVGYGR